jgi:hypothetical protein
MAEREILQNAIFVANIDERRSLETATTLGILGLEQVAFAGARAQNLAASCDFEAFCHRFSCFNTFWSSHKIVRFF